MNLGDLFWVNLFGYTKEDYRYNDTIYLIEFIKKQYNINLSFIEALNLWEYISGKRCAGWLCVDAYSEEELKDMIGYLFEEE